MCLRDASGTDAEVRELELARSTALSGQSELTPTCAGQARWRRGGVPFLLATVMTVELAPGRWVHSRSGLRKR